MDPHTGELWTEDQIDDLGRTNELAAQELKDRLVQVEGTDEAISELQTHVKQGIIAERLAKEIISVRPKMAIPKTRNQK